MMSYFLDYGAEILANFSDFIDTAINSNILGYNLFDLLLGGLLAVYVGWVIAKWIIGL